MPITVDSEMPSGVGASIALSNTLSYSFTNVNGTLLLVSVVAGGGTIINSIAVTYNGVSMTALPIQTGRSGTSAVQLFYLLNPTTGTNTVSVTVTATASEILEELISGAISFSGNKVVSPILQTASSNNSDIPSISAAVTLIGTSSISILVNAVGCGTSNSAGTDITTLETESWKKAVNNSSACGNGASGRAPGTGGDVTMEWSIPSDFWVISIVEIAAEPATPMIGTGTFVEAVIGGAGG